MSTRKGFVESSWQSFCESEYKNDGLIRGLFESGDPSDRLRGALTYSAISRSIRATKVKRGSLGESVTQASLGALNHHIYDVVRTFYPDLVSHILCDVQMMEGQSADIFRLVPTASDTEGIQFRGTTQSEVAGSNPPLRALDAVSEDEPEAFRHYPEGGYSSRRGESGLARLTYAGATVDPNSEGDFVRGATPGSASGNILPRTGTDFLPIQPGTVRLTVTGAANDDVGNPAVARDTGGGGVLTPTDNDEVGDQRVRFNTGGISLINYETGEIYLSLTKTGTEAVGYNVSVEFESAGSRELDSVIRDQAATRADGTLPRRLTFRLTKTTVKARLHPVRMDYSYTAALAAEQHLDVNVKSELTELAAHFLRVERDRQVIDTIIGGTAYSLGGGDTGRKTADSLDNDPWDAARPADFRRDSKYNEFAGVIDDAESLIQARTGRGEANWVLCGKNVSNVIRRIKGFKHSEARHTVGPYLDGTIRNGKVSVVRDILIDDDTFVVGYRGNSAGDSAVVVGDWIPLHVTDPFRAPEFEIRTGLATGYAILMNNPDYLFKGRITNYNEVA